MSRGHCRLLTKKNELCMNTSHRFPREREELVVDLNVVGERQSVFHGRRFQVVVVLVQRPFLLSLLFNRRQMRFLLNFSKFVC